MKKINKEEIHEIFSGLRNKNQNAYNKLYEKYYSLVEGITFSILKNKENAEDVTQEVFTKIYNMNPEKLPTECESSWLFTVSKNECYMFLRKTRPNINIDEIYEIPCKSNDLEEIVDIDYYNSLISHLNEQEKLIVSLKVLSNFTFKKISQIMNIPIGTVQWKYYKAVNSLKISISSLVGAAIAFIIALASGDLLHRKEYLNNDNESRITEEGYGEEQKNSNKAGDIITTDENDNTHNETQDAQNEKKQNSTEINESKDTQENIPQHEITEPMTISDSNLNTEKSIEINAFQTIFTIIGFCLLIIFLIFFRKYQQKLKRKSSKM